MKLDNYWAIKAVEDKLEMSKEQKDAWRATEMQKAMASRVMVHFAKHSQSFRDFLTTDPEARRAAAFVYENKFEFPLSTGTAPGMNCGPDKWRTPEYVYFCLKVI